MGLNAELTKKVENAIFGNRLVGNTSFRYKEYETLLKYARGFSITYSRGIVTHLCGDDKIIFMTLVEMAKRWKKIYDDENNESGFWEFVFKIILGIEGYDLKLYRYGKRERALPSEMRQQG